MFLHQEDASYPTLIYVTPNFSKNKKSKNNYKIITSTTRHGVDPKEGGPGGVPIAPCSV